MKIFAVSIIASLAISVSACGGFNEKIEDEQLPRLTPMSLSGEINIDEHRRSQLVVWDCMENQRDTYVACVEQGLPGYKIFINPKLEDLPEDGHFLSLCGTRPWYACPSNRYL